MEGPNPLAVSISIVRALWSTSRPTFGSTSGPSFDVLGKVLDDLASGGMKALAARRDDLDRFIDDMAAVPASDLTRDASLAFWLNLYNAGALRLAVTAQEQHAPSVLRLPGGFSSTLVTVEGEALSMDAIEHAKIRRFGDPRIHGALVCGSVSCPTLRAKPYHGDDLGGQLDEQMRGFLEGGGAVVDASAGRLELSRVFLWYGGDFVRPHRMPTFLPARRRALVRSLAPWMPETVADDVTVEYQSYDWGLRCAVA